MHPYINVTRAVGMALSARAATMKELQTFYGTQDLYTMLDVEIVDAYNKMKRGENGHGN